MEFFPLAKFASLRRQVNYNLRKHLLIYNQLEITMALLEKRGRVYY